jgi:hypothetical protein
MIGKITIEQIGPALILSDATDYIIKELEDKNIWRSVLIELKTGPFPFVVTHPITDTMTVRAAYDGINKYIAESNEDFKII